MEQNFQRAIFKEPIKSNTKKRENYIGTVKHGEASTDTRISGLSQRISRPMDFNGRLRTLADTPTDFHYYVFRWRLKCYRTLETVCLSVIVVMVNPLYVPMLLTTLVSERLERWALDQVVPVSIPGRINLRNDIF